MPFVCRIDLEEMVNEDAAPLACRRITESAGDRLRDLTKRYTPVDRSIEPSRPPGTARASIQRSPVTVREGLRGDRYKVTAFTEDPVFPFIEWNTRPHVIRARPGKSLRWVDGGGEHFARSVKHPGTTGQHCFARGALQLEAEVDDIARRPLRQFERDLIRRDVTL